MKKYSFIVNGEVFEKNVEREVIENLLKEWSRGGNLLNEEDEVIDFDWLVDCGVSDVFCDGENSENFGGRGCDYMTMYIFEM